MIFPKAIRGTRTCHFFNADAAKAEQMTDSARAVLVTGCSSGIGRATAIVLADNGYQVIATVRCTQQLEELRALELPNIEPYLLDVTDSDSISQLLEQVKARCPQGLYALVNNAGAGLPAAVELSEIEEVRRLLEVNTLGPLRMIQEFLPLLRAGRGRIINISSMNGTLALPMVGAYSASKFALEALCDTLRVELRPWRIPVVIIRPGQVRTSIFAKARKQLAAQRRRIPHDLRNGYEAMYDQAGEFNERGADSKTTPEMAAATVLRAMQASSPRSHYLVGLDARGMQIAKALVPQWLLDRVFARVMRVLKPVRPSSPEPQTETVATGQVSPSAVSQQS